VQYLKYKPHILLQKYIDFYWVLQTDKTALKVPLFSDVTTDVFINMGNTAGDVGSLMLVAPGNMYMGGPGTCAFYFNCFPGNVFIGIRFKPGGLPLFYHVPLADMVDQIIEFRDPQLASILDVDELLPSRLDEYFLSKKKTKHSATIIADAVYQYKGRISVDMLAKECNMSNRTLERYFYNHMGIGPKEFINIIRFRQVLLALQNGSTRGELVKIAAELGYYDQSHFIKEVKKRAGSIPSAIGPITNFT